MQLSLGQEVSNVEKAIENNRGAGYNADDLKAFLRLWNKVPLEWKLQCKHPPSDRIKVNEWKKDSIIIPKVLLDQLAVWEDEPLSILTVATLPDGPGNDIARRLWLALNSIHIVDEIRSRILQIMLYILINKLGSRQLRTNSTVEAEFLERINVDGDENIKQTKAWATTGGKLYSLSLELSSPTEPLGPIICMPEDIKRYKLERLPQSGEVRKSAIELLKTRGINNKENCDIERCYTVGKKIWQATHTEIDSYYLQCAPLPIVQKRPKRKVQTGKSQRRRKKLGSQPSVECRSRSSSTEGEHDSLGEDFNRMQTLVYAAAHIEGSAQHDRVRPVTAPLIANPTEATSEASFAAEETDLFTSESLQSSSADGPSAHRINEGLLFYDWPDIQNSWGLNSMISGHHDIALPELCRDGVPLFDG